MADFIADASIVCSWVLPDEGSLMAGVAFDHLQHGSAMAPDLLWHEVRNVLMMSCRRKRISFDMVRQAMRVLRNLDIVILDIRDEDLILELADRHGLTSYDAAYLALSLERGLPLATLDRQLAAAAARERVALLA